MEQQAVERPITMFQHPKTAPRQVLEFAQRPHRLATRIADKTANPRYSKPAQQLWLVAYRNAFDVVTDEGPVLSRRWAIALAITTFGLGLLLRGAL